jgi:hypothetical protein
LCVISLMFSFLRQRRTILCGNCWLSNLLTQWWTLVSQDNLTSQIYLSYPLSFELPPVMSYDRLLSSWTAEYQNHHNGSSFLRAMFCSYGWTYLRLGLLKVPFSFYWGCSIE